MIHRLALTLVAASLLTPALAAQDTATKPAERADAAPAAAEPLSALEYRLIGPANGGRVSRAQGVPGDPTTYWAATASGGVWKSTDGGATWASVFDDQPVSSIGSLAIAPSNPNIVYVGSGEANIRGNVAAGNGIYKTVDAGKTWTHVWKQEGQIGTMLVHPTNPDIAYAAVLGKAFGPNDERGVYRTTDGGKTWQQVLKKDRDTGASDIAMDPSNPAILFAGFWQARRTPWDLTSGGPGSGLYASRDGGDTWKHLTGNGLPDGIWGKVGVAVAPSNGSRVYALIEAEGGGLFKSDDGGENWSLATANRAIRQRAWYYTTLTVHPTNQEEIWFPQVPLLRTIDGGRTLEYMKGLHHGDHHDLWIDPKDPKRMISANDGGVDITVNAGKTWFAPALPISQFYHVSVDNSLPYRVAGAMQDWGTAQGPSMNLRGRGIALADWYSVGGGEAGYVVSDWKDPDVIYAGEYLGIITRHDRRTGESRNVSAWPDNPSGWGGEAMKYRFQWTAPIHVSPHDPKVVYHGAQVIFRTTNGGQSWDVISPDLTRNDKSKQKWSGGPITGDNTGVETWSTVFAIAESPKQQGLIWAGTDDGRVHVTRDGGKNWTDVTGGMKGAPQLGTVSIIEPSPFDAATAYVVIDNHRLDDNRPYLYKTSDLGASWKPLHVELPEDVYLHVVREDPAKRGQLYLGTERGVMFSTDDGATWRPLQLNLPTVAVHDLVVKNDDLVVGTHGRSVYILDDLQPVRAIDATVLGASVHLFPVADAIRWRRGDGHWAGHYGRFSNPPVGASIYYYLKDEPKGPVTIDILDSANRLVKTLSSVPRQSDRSGDEDDTKELKDAALPTAAGVVHRAVWDLTWEGSKKIQGAKIDFGDPAEGPTAVPGSYTVRLTAGGQTLTSPLIVTWDPREQAPQADLEAQLAFSLRVRDTISKLTGLVHAIQSVREQLRARAAALEPRKSDAGIADLLKAGDALIEKINQVEAKLHNPSAEVTYDILAQRGGARLYSRLSPLQMWIVSGDGLPTAGMQQVLAEYEQELAPLEAEVESLLSRDLGDLNARAKSLNVDYVSRNPPVERR
jgi:photosystem II stability/assembly factor-like uncharacterized protein